MNESKNDGSNGPENRPSAAESEPINVDAVAEAKSEAEKFKNEYLYLRAEFENFKKQVIKERSDMRKYGSERLVSDLLNVLDIFETALATDVTPESVANFRKGIDMTAAELKNVLQRHGISEVPSKGLPFDPVIHEALSSEETNSAAPGTITQVFKKPYKLHDRVVRPGQVVVAKAPALKS
jgi:molecular chaperone GrpE